MRKQEMVCLHALLGSSCSVVARFHEANSLSHT